MTNPDTAMRDIIARMRSADSRWQVPPAGAVVIADSVDAWADELEALLATPPATPVERRYHVEAFDEAGKRIGGFAVCGPDMGTALTKAGRNIEVQLRPDQPRMTVTLLSDDPPSAHPPAVSGDPTQLPALSRFRTGAFGAMVPDADGPWVKFEDVRPVVDGRALTEQLALVLAHRGCCNEEHDPAAGKIAGFCVVCGVPWPCQVAIRLHEVPALQPAEHCR